MAFPSSSQNPYLLYAITDRTWLQGRSLQNVVQESLEGGVTCLQLREKHLSLSAVIQEAKIIKPLCQTYCVPFIINDQVEVALAVDADGVHVGQNDTNAQFARSRIGPNKILGVSVENVSQALQAQQNGANYVGVGTIFKTNTKPDAKAVSIQILREICQAVSIPVVAIGGISVQNVSLLSNSGISGIAVISAIYAQKNILQATRYLRTQAEAYFGKNHS